MFVWGAGRIRDVRVVGGQVEMDGDFFGVLLMCMWQDCMCQVVEV